jgi:hypothetical protein
MKIIDIFVVVKDSLYSVVYDSEDGQSAYEALFNRWQDVEYLEQFFEDNVDDLKSGFYGNITVEKAVLQTLGEGKKFDRTILDAATNGQKKNNKPLEEVIFKTLHQDVLSHIHIASKAYGPNKKSWLRLYAIRIAANLYVVSGGAIKLTEKMTPKHLKDELDKLKKTAAYLKEIGFEFEEELGYIEIGNYDND